MNQGRMGLISNPKTDSSCKWSNFEKYLIYHQSKTFCNLRTACKKFYMNTTELRIFEATIKKANSLQTTIKKKNRLRLILLRFALHEWIHIDHLPTREWYMTLEKTDCISIEWMRTAHHASQLLVFSLAFGNFHFPVPSFTQQCKRIKQSGKTIRHN